MRTAAVAVVAVWWTVCLIEEVRYRRQRAARRVAARRAVFASRGAR
jgi:hypothetical protein